MSDVSFKNVVIEDAEIEGLVINGVRIDELLKSQPKV
jgi:hypothetical protein